MVLASTHCVMEGSLECMHACPLPLAGGTFALYSSICRHVGISPAHPKEDHDVVPHSIWTSASDQPLLAKCDRAQHSKATLCSWGMPLGMHHALALTLSWPHASCPSHVIRLALLSMPTWVLV